MELNFCCSIGLQLVMCLILLFALADEADERDTTGSTAHTEDYCMLESFQPRCMKNEAILMKGAIYGRMRIGRCLTAQEIDTFGAVYKVDPKNDPLYFGCSVNVLPILDRKCSGKTQCDFRQLEISDALENKPCYPGLTMYLEVSYDCIAIADEDRSCNLAVSNVPIHVMASSDSKRKCGTQSQPWVIEAPPGQKVKVTLIDFLASQFSETDDRKRFCPGTTVDKTAKMNISLCVGGDQRTKYLYSSAAEILEIFYNTTNKKEINVEVKPFALKFEAVGCTDLISPEDAWLKRSDDSIVIGCYSNRQTWQLHCEGERWIGVFGNCSQANFDHVIENPEIKEHGWRNEQILTVIAVGGLTLTICLAVLCTGIVCLRKFSTGRGKNEDYKILDLLFNSSVMKSGSPQVAANGVHSNSATHQQMAPTYSVFVGDGEFNDNPQSNQLH